MYTATGHATRESAEAMLVMDKRARSYPAAPREGESWPIGELGSKAIYQVSATRFSAATPNK
jgi:hypothetical protein